MNQSRRVINCLFLIAAASAVLPRLAAAEPASPAGGHGFELRPAKIEAALAAASETKRELLITNHTAASARLSVSLEDFGPYSLLPYLTLLRRSALLAPGESVTVPFLISLPENLPAPGFYGAVIVSFAVTDSAGLAYRPASPELQRGEPAGAGGAVEAVSRLGALLFVRVRGAPAEENGELVGFGLLGRRLVRRGEPIAFHIDYENRGDIYLNPYGLLTVTGRFSEAEFNQELEPWFVLPASARLREITLAAPLAAGLYRAHLALNRGYGDIVDEASVTFIVWSWFSVGLGLFAVLILFMLTRFVRGKIKKP
ncbi:MAG: hypothetical protein HY481_02335 [Candidatus Vogelbacteria bacterium]|nr:hypothetical protein [Candidatus Vogelbacteria bacterium]